MIDVCAARRTFPVVGDEPESFGVRRLSCFSRAGLPSFFIPDCDAGIGDAMRTDEVISQHARFLLSLRCTRAWRNWQTRQI
jgi:hypothetical protein